MKKQILGLGLFMMVLGSCNKEDSDSGNYTDESMGYIKADYIVDVDHNDFIINNDNMVYTVGAQLKKIDLEGKITTLMNLDKYKFYNGKISNTTSGDILVCTSDHDYGNILFRFEKNYTELNPFYTMKRSSSPFAPTVRISAICNNEDGTYFVFDYNLKSIKRVILGVNNDILVAGSEKAEIKDGVGLDASFQYIYQIISKDNIVYLIDGTSSLGYTNTIRKMEYTDKGWKVTTLITTTTDVYQNIAMDSQNNFYVLVKDKGIYKLNLQDNTLSVYKEGTFKAEALMGNKSIGIWKEYKSISFMAIKNDDLYLGDSGAFVKISNFQSKL